MNYLKKVLLRFSEDSKDAWTVDDAMKGISIFGGTGSGKTSASGRTLALKYLNEGWGGIVLCAKPDEAGLWKDYCEETGRTKDLIVFEKNAVHKEEGELKGQLMIFNPVDYELRRPGEGAGETQNITNIFMNIYRMGNRIAGGGDNKEERFWDMALKRCLNRVIELLKLAGEDLSFKNMVQVLSSCSNINEGKFASALAAIGDGKEEYPDSENYSLQCLLVAYQSIEGVEDSGKEQAFEMVYRYFTHDFGALGGRTRSTVMESFMGLAEPFLSGLLFKHFAGRTNLFPEWTFEKQKIIVLDFPIKEYLEAGITAQCVFKLMFQQAVERRDVKIYPTPVFLWCDEAQMFMNPYDQIFLTTARSSMTSTVFLTQNISNYLATMGAGEDAKPKVDSLLGNLSTKIFHANMDAETNEYASRLIGQDLIAIESGGRQTAQLSLGETKSEGFSMQLLPQVMAREFTTLKTGGEGNNFEVQSVVAVSGRRWSDGKNYKKVTFVQSFNN